MGFCFKTIIIDKLIQSNHTMLKLQSMLLPRKLENYCNIPSMLSLTGSSFSPCISSTCRSFAILIDTICSCKTVNKIQTFVLFFAAVVILTLFFTCVLFLSCSFSHSKLWVNYLHIYFCFVRLFITCDNTKTFCCIFKIYLMTNVPHCFL